MKFSRNYGFVKDTSMLKNWWKNIHHLVKNIQYTPNNMDVHPEAPFQMTYEWHERCGNITNSAPGENAGKNSGRWQTAWVSHAASVMPGEPSLKGQCHEIFYLQFFLLVNIFQAC